MRGPGLRVKYDVRRHWTCPECGYERKVPGHVVAVRCHCDEGTHWMELREPQREVRPEVTPLNPYVDVAEVLGDEPAPPPPPQVEPPVFDVPPETPSAPGVALPEELTEGAEEDGLDQSSVDGPSESAVEPPGDGGEGAAEGEETPTDAPKRKKRRRPRRRRKPEANAGSGSETPQASKQDGPPKKKSRRSRSRRKPRGGGGTDSSTSGSPPASD